MVLPLSRGSLEVAPWLHEIKLQTNTGVPSCQLVFLVLVRLLFLCCCHEQDSQISAEVQTSSKASHESQVQQQNVPATDAPVTGSVTVPVSTGDNKKVSCEDIELVQNLIERCLQLYMNKAEVVRTLSNRARIEPGFTSLVWQKLEEENADFFRAYYIRLKLKKQIILFNHLLEHQYCLMKYPMPSKVPLVPMQNGIHSVPVNNLPMGHPVLQQPSLPVTGQPHLGFMGCGVSSCHVVNGIPAPGSVHPLRVNSGNDSMPEMAPAAHLYNTMPSVSEMAASPASVTSSNHFPFAPSEISGMEMDTSTLNVNFTSDVANTGGLQLGPDGEVGSPRALGQLWSFNLSDLTEDFANFGDLGAFGDFNGSPILPSDSDILLDSPEQDDIVEYFADPVTGICSQSDEEKP